LHGLQERGPVALLDGVDTPERDPKRRVRAAWEVGDNHDAQNGPRNFPVEETTAKLNRTLNCKGALDGKGTLCAGKSRASGNGRGSSL